MKCKSMNGNRIRLTELRICAEAGLTIKQTAARMGYHPGSIWRCAVTNNINFARGKNKPRRHQKEIISLIRKGVRTAPEIAGYIGIKKNATARALIDLSDRGLVERGKLRRDGRFCRPAIEWRLTPTSELFL